MCLGRNGLGGNLVTFTEPGLQVLWIGAGDSIRVDPIINMGLTDRWINGNGRRSRWVRSISEMVWLVL